MLTQGNQREAHPRQLPAAASGSRPSSSSSTPNGSWCHWCGGSSFLPTARGYVERIGEETFRRDEVWLTCFRCGHVHDTPPTQSTLRPVRTADPFNPARRHHRSRMDAMCPSVAWALLSNENVDVAYMTLTPFAERRDSGRPDIRRALSAKVLGICAGCGAWPGETHWLSENPECPRDPELLAPLTFWGRWWRFVNDGADSALRVRALTFAAARAVAGMAGLFELRPGDESDRAWMAHRRIQKDRLRAARRRWDWALEKLPAPVPAAQLSRLEAAQTQIEFINQHEAHP